LDRQEQRHRSHSNQSGNGADDSEACEAKASAGWSNRYATGGVSSSARSGGFSKTWHPSVRCLAFSARSGCIRFARSPSRRVAPNAGFRVAATGRAASTVCGRFCLPSHDSMNATGIPLKEPAVSAAAGATEQLERAYIDASTRVPVLMFYTSAMAWLILGTLLAGFVSFKLHSPDLLSDISFLTWGRVRPAHMNVMVYGWASMAGMGTAIWLMARLCRTVLRYPLLLVAGAGFWNLGVLLGVAASFSATAPAMSGSSSRATQRSFCSSRTRSLPRGRCLCFAIDAANKFTSPNGICSARFSGFHGCTRPGN